MIIEYYTIMKFGGKVMMINDDNTAFVVSALTKKKSINENDIKALQYLGVSFKEVLDPNRPK